MQVLSPSWSQILLRFGGKQPLFRKNKIKQKKQQTDKVHDFTLREVWYSSLPAHLATHSVWLLFTAWPKSTKTSTCWTNPGTSTLTWLCLFQQFPIERQIVPLYTQFRNQDIWPPLLHLIIVCNLDSRLLLWKSYHMQCWQRDSCAVSPAIICIQCKTNMSRAYTRHWDNHRQCYHLNTGVKNFGLGKERSLDMYGRQY